MFLLVAFLLNLETSLGCFWGRMKFSHLAAVVTVILASFGPVKESELTDWQEDCAGAGHLTQGVLLFGLRGHRRDVSWLSIIHVHHMFDVVAF